MSLIPVSFIIRRDSSSTKSLIKDDMLTKHLLIFSTDSIDI